MRKGKLLPAPSRKVRAQRGIWGAQAGALDGFVTATGGRPTEQMMRSPSAAPRVRWPAQAGQQANGVAATGTRRRAPLGGRGRRGRGRGRGGARTRGSSARGAAADAERSGQISSRGSDGGAYQQLKADSGPSKGMSRGKIWLAGSTNRSRKKHEVYATLGGVEQLGPQRGGAGLHRGQSGRVEQGARL